VIPFNPLTEIPAFNKKRDRRHERTSFVPVFERLLATVEGSRRVYRGVAGIDRAELYHAAACTGLREGTLRLLEVGQFQLDKVPAFVKARADQLKDGDDLVVPIQADSAARIAKYFAGKMPSTRAFKCPPFDYDFARMLKKDLAEAGIPYCREVELANGRRRREQVLDFHALRHTFGSWCAAANVPLTTTQRWMGHSTPELTANLYTHVIPADQAAAVASMPPLPGVKRAS
jgi:integrase